MRATERSNLTVKNGTVAFCFEGIYLDGDSNANINAVDAVIDNMRVTYCFYFGIYVNHCPASTITNCKVSQTGYNGANFAYGIAVFSSGTFAQNTVSTVTATNSYGIYASGSLVRQNSISNARYCILNGKYQDNLTLECTYPFVGGTDAGNN